MYTFTYSQSLSHSVSSLLFDCRQRHCTARVITSNVYVSFNTVFGVEHPQSFLCKTIEAANIVFPCDLFVAVYFSIYCYHTLFSAANVCVKKKLH